MIQNSIMMYHFCIYCWLFCQQAYEVTEMSVRDVDHGCDAN